jgi:L-ribulokinase
MQVLADVLDMTIDVRAGEQPVAIGAAMFAATAAGIHATVEDAQRAMSSGTEARYRPDPERVRLYDSLYREYRKLGSFVEEELTP